MASIRNVRLTADHAECSEVVATLECLSAGMPTLWKFSQEFQTPARAHRYLAALSVARVAGCGRRSLR
ncbi:MAG: hypothetical protein ACT4NU_06615 [Chromatiales bacterium]